MATGKIRYKLKLLVLLCLCVAGSALAVDAVWKNTDAAPSGVNARWGNPTNWVDGGGATLTVAPTNENDNVYLPLPAWDKQFTLDITTGIITGGDLKVGHEFQTVTPDIHSITGSLRYTVTFSPFNSNFHKLGDWTPQRFKVYDPSGFAGFWMTGNAYSGFLLPATPSHSPHMSALSGKNRPTIEVPTAGTSATLDYLYDGGMLEKTGAGTLTVETAATNSSINVAAGDIVLGGMGDAAINAICDKAWIHLDADDETTTQTTLKDGRQAVVTWKDVRGEGRPSAVEQFDHGSYLAYVEKPFISPAVSPTGRRLVDFGTNPRYGNTDYGPTNCLMKFSSVCTTIREVFYAVWAPNSYSFCNVIGSKDNTSWHFLNNSSSTFFTKASTVENSAASSVLFGDLSYNGQHFSSYAKLPDTRTVTNMFVLGVASEYDLTAALFGSDRLSSLRTGGFRIGELLIFTNNLTRAERTRINRYLMRKWCGENEMDFPMVRVATAATKIGVPEGRTAKVGELVAAAGTATKTGEGTLQVGRLYPADAKIDVRGGGVGFLERPAPSTSAPAEEPAFWLDANHVTTTTFDGYDADYVTTWNDCRAGASQNATTGVATPPQVPKLIPNALNGLPVVDFGTQAAGDNAYMWTSLGTTKKFYAGFVVLCYTQNMSPSPFTGNNNMEFFRSGGTRILSYSYNLQQSPAATWTRNGMIVDPRAEYSLRDDSLNQYFVIAFSGTSPQAVAGIVFDPSNTAATKTKTGCMRIGEMLLYDRMLSEQERIDTEAYLMKRWLNADHPAALVSPTVAFAGDKAVNLSAEGSVAVASVSGGNGTYVKTGSGDFEVQKETAVANQASIIVEEGELKMPLGPFNLDAEAVFRFDASETSSFTTQVVDDGNGGVKTNILKWADATGNGHDLTPKFNTYATVYPVLTTVETAPGVFRPTVDMGEYSGLFIANRGETNITTGAAARLGFAGSVSVTDADAYLVFSDAHGANKCAFFGAAQNYLRGHRTPGTVFEAYNQGTGVSGEDWFYAMSSVRDNAVVDGVPRPISYVLPAGFHVIAVSNNTGKASSYSYIGGLGCTHTWDGFYKEINESGGAYYSEVIVFGRALSAKERGYLQAHLAHKWLGGAAPVWTNMASSVTVRNGGRLDLVNGNSLSVPTLTGSGAASIRAGELIDVTTLNFDWKLGDVAPGSLTVDGKVSVGSTVNVTVAYDEGVRHIPGEYPLLTATAIENGATAKWHLSTPGRPVRRGCGAYLALSGNTLTLRLTKPGITINFR
jgi:hypothetical protein